MISDLDIYRTAQATISRYGGEAALHGAQRADELLAAGAKGKAAGEIKAVWRWIKRRL